MDDFKKRVVEEKNELDSKLTRLGSFLNGDIFKTISDDEKTRMQRQYKIMKEYSDILDERINNFS